ncbi:MAG: translocation/assembly module TamB domain-containing protein [Myxococcota bacterium]
MNPEPGGEDGVSEAQFEPLIKRRLVGRILTGIGVGLALLFFVGVGFLVWAFQTGRALEFARKSVVETLRDSCGVRAEFSEIRLDPTRRQLQFSNLLLTDDDGRDLLAVEEALAALQLLPLFYGRFQLERVALLGPKAQLVFDGPRITNLPACVRPSEDRPSPGPPPAPLALGVDELTVERGTIDVHVGEWTAHFDDIGIALVPASGGGTDLAVGIDEGALTSPRGTSKLRRFRLLGHLGGLLTRPRALNFDRLQLDVEGVRVDASGSIDLMGPVADLDLAFELPLARLRTVLPSFPEAEGELSVDAHLSGTLASPRLAGRLDAEALQVDKFGPFDRVGVQFRADRRAVLLDELDVGFEGGGIVAQGSIQLEPGFPTELEVEAQSLSLASLLHRLNVPDPWVDFRASGPARFTGALDPFVLEGPFDFETERFFVTREPARRHRSGSVADIDPELLMLDSRPRRVRGVWRYEPRWLTIDSAELLGDGSQGRANAKIGLKSGLTHLIDLDFERLDMADVGRISGIDFGGVGPLRAQLRFEGPVLGGRGWVAMRGLRVGGVPLGDVASPVEWSRTRFLAFEAVEGQVGRTAYKGRFAFGVADGTPSELEVEVPAGRVEDILIPLRLDPETWGRPKGAFRGKGRVTGPFLEMTGPIEAAFGSVQAYGESFGSGVANMGLRDGAFVFSKVRLRKADRWVEGSGLYDPEKRLRLQVSVDELPLVHVDAVQRQAPGLNGVMSFALQMDGPPESMAGDWSLRVPQLKAGTLSLGELRGRGPVEASTALGELGLDGGEVGALLTKLSLGLSSGLRFQLDGRADRFALPTVWGRATEAGLGLEGELSADFAISGLGARLDRLAGELSLETASLGYGLGEVELPPVELAGPSTIRIQEGVFAGRMAWTGEGVDVEIDGQGGRDSLDGQLRGRLGLQLLEDVTRSAERSGGQFVFDARLAGSLLRPGLVGSGEIKDANLLWSGIVEPFTNVSARVDFSRNTVLFDGVRGTWGGGGIEGNGSLQLDSGAVSFFARLDGTRPRFALSSADLVGRLSGNLDVGGRWDALRVGGRLQVARPLVEPRVDIRTFVEEPALDAYDPAAELVEFDVALDLRDPIRIRSDTFDTQASGELRFTGTNQRPGLLGSLVFARGGRVTFLARDYVFRSGVVEFGDRYRFAPRYDLALETEVCSATIRVLLTGTLEDFDTAYSSTPEMDQRNIVSCLIRGIRTRELDDERAIGAFAGSALLKLSGVDQEVKKVIPVDQIDVTTEFSSQAREYQPRLVVAKDLSFFDRAARLEYSSSLVQTSDQRAAVRLRLTPRLNLRLGWTSSLDVPFGDWGLDLEQRWEW